MKKRLDQLVFEKGLADSRTKAQGLIMAGLVFIDGKIADKAGLLVNEETEIELKEKFPYVSRGALKLEKAYQEFGIDFDGKVVCDIGSSTGGFTDFALQHGAKKVFAIDVGRGQLDQKLREDPRIVVMEKTDFRDVEVCLHSSCHHEEPSGALRRGDLRTKKIAASNFAENSSRNDEICITEPIDIFVCDVSFILLKKIIPKIAEIIDIYSSSEAKRNREVNSSPQGRAISTEAILLIKPQFEVGRKEASRGKGVITDPALHQKVIEEIKAFATENGFKICGLTESPITGAKGNKEFLLWIEK